MPTSCGDLAVTITIGAAELTDQTTDLAALIESANQVERQAKHLQKKSLGEGT
jgi:hypothetical protein